METINVEVRVNQRVDVDVDLYLVIDSINELPITKRWNYVASIINSLPLETDEMTLEQKQITKKYLLSRLEKLENIALIASIRLTFLLCL